MTAGKKDISAPGMALRTAAILFVFVILFTGLLSAGDARAEPATSSPRSSRSKAPP